MRISTLFGALSVIGGRKATSQLIQLLMTLHSGLGVLFLEECCLILLQVCCMLTQAILQQDTRMGVVAKHRHIKQKDINAERTATSTSRRRSNLCCVLTRRAREGQRQVAGFIATRAILSRDHPCRARGRHLRNDDAASLVWKIAGEVMV